MWFVKFRSTIIYIDLLDKALAQLLQAQDHFRLSEYPAASNHQLSFMPIPLVFAWTTVIFPHLPSIRPTWRRRGLGHIWSGSSRGRADRVRRCTGAIHLIIENHNQETIPNLQPFQYIVYALITIDLLPEQHLWGILKIRETRFLQGCVSVNFVNMPTITSISHFPSQQ